MRQQQKAAFRAPGLVAAVALATVVTSLPGHDPTARAGDSQTAAVPAVMVYSLTATPVSEFPVSLTAGVPVTFRTTEIFDTEDPVLHLFSSGGSQVAVADSGGGGRAAYLSYTPTASGSYRLMVRSRTPSSFGLADILMNNAAWQTDIVFAGAQLGLSDIRSGERLETTVMAGGVIGPHRLYVLGTDGLSVAGRSVGDGPNSGAQWTASTPRASATVVIGSPQTIRGGTVRLARNDVLMAGHDPDGDGLGDELESKIGTCSTRVGIRAGFDCARAADARDTDGDGIGDGWEFFGRRVFRLIGVSGLGYDYETLPRWGANPRHKDLFVEVDFMLRCASDVPQKMSAVNARAFAAYYQDTVGAPTAAQRAAHAATLRNPDGLTGIATHLDTGLAPETTADATTYGNWGGYTAVPRPDPGSTECKGADYSTAWMTNMTSARRGIFRYALTYAGGGGQTGVNSFAFSGPMTAASTLAHESGHAMGLGHSGPAGASFVDVNCKPNYPSLMNYAYLYKGAGFGDGSGAPSLNNAALREAGAASTSNTAYLDALEQVFGYWVNRATGDVDWNRDGAIAAAGTTVRAYANYQPNGSCEYTRYNESAVPTGPAESSRLAPAIARLNQRVYVFYVKTTGELRYAHSDSEWLCPRPDATACATWSTPQRHPLPAAQGVDAEHLDSPNSLLAVSVDSLGRVWQARLTTDVNHIETWTSPTLIPGSSTAVGEPSLARRGLCTMYLTYKATDNSLRHRRWTCGGGWDAEQQSLTDAGAPIVLPSYASPGTAGGYLPSRPGAVALIGAFAGSNGSLRLWRLDEALGRWVATNDLKTSSGAVEGRPALAWVSTTATVASTGRLYLMWIKHDTAQPEKRTVRMAMSFTKVITQADGTTTRTPQVGLNADFDNVWHYAHGIDLLFERGYDLSLISAESRSSDTEGPTSIMVRPKADGINDFTYLNYNDWTTLRLALCRNVVNPGGLGPNAVTCP